MLFITSPPRHPALLLLKLHDRLRGWDQAANMPLSLSGKLRAYDADGDGDFDVEDAKVLLGKSICSRSCFSVAS